MSRRDGKARLPWSVKGVTTEARELAKAATARNGGTTGDWLSDVIRRVGAAQAAGRPIAPPHRRGLPTLPGRRPVPEPPSAPVPAAPEAVDEAAFATLVAERVERTEARLVGLLESLEDIVGRLADRLDQLERGLDERAPDQRDRADRRPFPRS